MTPMRIMALVAVMLACAVARPAVQSPYGICGYIAVGGSAGGDAAYGYATVIENGSCWYGTAYVQVEVWAPGGGYDSDYDYGPGYAFADAAAPLSPGLSGNVEVRGTGALEVGDPEWGAWYEGYQDYYYYPVSVPPGGGGGGSGNQCSASGTVFIDYNQNGLFDGGDAPLSGTTVYLTDSSGGSVIDAYVTESSGGYQFGGLAEGSYRVAHPVPGGYYRTTDDSVPFSACTFAYDFGIAPEAPPPPPVGQCSASGRVFHDYNENGTFDEGDAPVSGTTVYLTDPGNTYVIGTSETGSSGGYEFEELNEGSYRVTHPVPGGYVRTTDDSLVFSACAFEFDFGIAQQAPPQPPPPELRLFLDVNNNFAQPGDDDLPQYVPGANLDGTSVPIQPEGTPLQTVRVIAAFVNASGQIVPPPVQQVTFTLPQSTAFTGYAMNAGSSTSPDFAFVPAQPQVTAGFQNNLSWANVGVFDYGGTATARATAEGFQPVEIRIPGDSNTNGIADAGWRAYGQQSHPAQQAAECMPANCQWQEDSDGTPTGTGPPGYGTVGDGLVLWEEYRGFVVRGTHVRTHPGYKDLFVSSNVTVNNDLDAALEYARENLRVNNVANPPSEIGVRVHRVWGQDNTAVIPPGQFIEYKIDPQVTNPDQAEQRRINFNEPLSSPVALNSQKAVRIRAALPNELPMGKVGLWNGFCYPPAPPTTGGGVPFSTREVVIGVAQHQGNQHELKRTIAHEIGHAINVMHRGPVPDGCPDGAMVGTATSVMSDFDPNGSGNVSSPGAQYNGNDVPQIRIRWHP